MTGQQRFKILTALSNTSDSYAPGNLTRARRYKPVDSTAACNFPVGNPSFQRERQRH